MPLPTTRNSGDTGHIADHNSIVAEFGVHAADADPHAGYQKESEKAAANGYAGLGAGGLVATAQLATGTASATTYLRGDGQWQTPAGGGSGHTIQDEGTTLTTRSKLNFVGAGVVATDDATNDRSIVTIPGGGSGTYSGPLFYNVKSYGAVGNGTTDDTAAVIAARDAMIAARITSNSAGTDLMTATLYFPAGVYKVTSANALFTSPTTGTAQILRNIKIMGEGRRSSEILFSSGATASTDPRANNLMVLANRVRGFRMEHMSIRSDNANQSFAYLWCSVTNDGTVTPSYGSGAQNDFVWLDVELRGSWKRGWGLDGDSAANQNSEQHWDRCSFSNDTTFTDAAVRIGIAPITAQMDQFVNYTFSECNFEYNGGDLIVAEKGGFINIRGGSWIVGIGGGSGTLVKMTDQSHFDNIKNLHMQDTRVEFRTVGSKLLDTYWANANSFITLENVGTMNNTLPSATQPEHEIMTFHSTSNLHPNFKASRCQFVGFVYYDLATAPISQQGRMMWEQCNSKSWTFLSGAAGFTPSTTTGFQRYAGTTPPKYQTINCWNIADVKN